MQKKCLVFVMTLISVAQMTIGAEHNVAKEDPFEQLPEHLRKCRNDKDNMPYADAMKDGVKAIDRVLEQNKAKIEIQRKQREREICRHRGWWPEPEDTVVGQLDKQNNKEKDDWIEAHKKMAKIYTDFAAFMHNDLIKDEQKNFDRVLTSFRRMKIALEECPLKNEACYDRYCVSSYDKMANPAHRRKIRDDHYATLLTVAHNNNIPVTDDELRFIIKKNQEYNKIMTEIDELENSIADLVDPEKIKEREKKRMIELQEQKVKAEQEKVQALKEQLKQDNESVNNENSEK